jgi:hypothetical protein
VHITSYLVRLVTCAALVLVCAGCGGDGTTGTGFPHSPGVRAVLGANVTDTIEALQTQALVVEVREPGGELARGAVVRFEAQPPADSARRNEAAVYVCALSAQACGWYSNGAQFISDTTDDRGRAKAIIRLGSVAGRAVVRLTVPEFGMVDSTAFTVTPGAVAQVRAFTPDTGLDVGATATLSGHVTDRFNNPRAEQPTLSLGTGSAVTLDPAKAVVTATAMGTQWLYTRYGTMVDSTSVRVVPSGRLVVWAAGAREIRLVTTSGAGGSRTLATGVSSDFGAFPHFDATRRRVTMHSGSQAYGGPSNTVVVIDTGTLARRTIGPDAEFSTIITVRQRDDGTLLVVGHRTTLAGYALWSVATDDVVTHLVDLPALLGAYDGADITRDGARVAYLAQGSLGAVLRLLDVATGTTVDLRGGVRSPRWSPNGDRLAYLVAGNHGEYDGTAAVANSDGSGEKVLGFVFSPGLAWSPDGSYLLGRSSDADAGLRIIRVSDGATVMLRFRAPGGWFEDYYQPDWR